jgi:hypothetical protein
VFFSAGLDQWRHFKSYLGPLEAAFEQEGAGILKLHPPR